MQKTLKNLKSYKSQSIYDDLSCLKTYFDDNRLTVNVDKCEFMLIGTYQALRKIPSSQIQIKELGWLSLENRRCMHKCTMVFKYRNG